MLGGEGGRSTYGLGERLRSELSGSIISAHDSVGDRGDCSPAGTWTAAATMVIGGFYIGLRLR
jgi:hypothetical protein